jgi:hypothetical protein
LPTVHDDEPKPSTSAQARAELAASRNVSPAYQAKIGKKPRGRPPAGGRSDVVTPPNKKKQTKKRKISEVVADDGDDEDDLDEESLFTKAVPVPVGTEKGFQSRFAERKNVIFYCDDYYYLSLAP